MPMPSPQAYAVQPQPYDQTPPPPDYQQAVPPPPPLTHPEQWSSSLYDCFSDMGVCCVGAHAPFVLYGENAEKIGTSSFLSAAAMYFFFSCCACCFAHETRGALRHKYGLPEEPCSDCMVHCWCSPCAVCQETRELRKRKVQV
ncbi:PLAC8 family-domain-containing protein [Haematococcus lacustris]